MKFKIGDSVRVIARTTCYFDEVGKVVDVDQSHVYPFRVAGLETSPLWFGPDELILAECPAVTA